LKESTRDDHLDLCFYLLLWVVRGYNLHVFYTSVLSNHLKLLEQVMFIVLGTSKAEVLQRVFERPALPGALPAQMVRPNEGEDAASKLAIASWSDPKKFPFFDWSSLNQSKTSIGKATSS
jgi:hypothetical protein